MMFLTDKNCKTFIIAEIGVNHNGDIDLAYQLIDAAKAAGADAAKFQTFDPAMIVVPAAPKAEYQKQNTGNSDSQHKMLTELQFGEKEFKAIKAYCEEKKIRFLSTPFDLNSLELLMSLDIELLKVSSGDITNGPLLLRMAQTDLPIILSTGLSDSEDIKNALSILAFGYINKTLKPNNLEECRKLLGQEDTRALLKNKVSLLHCTTDYPAKIEDINMLAMDSMKEQFGLEVGYSDHSDGIIVPVVAVSLGARIIEKHLTLDKELPGPDHKASLNPEEFAMMVGQIRTVEKILGMQVKQPTKNELRNKNIVRRGIYAAEDIQSGEEFSEDNLITLRPENCSSPLNIWSFYGKKANRDYKKYEAV